MDESAGSAAASIERTSSSNGVQSRNIRFDITFVKYPAIMKKSMDPLNLDYRYAEEGRMRDDVKEWLERKGEEVLRKTGIRRGQTVLDFGCGSGLYAIPIAKIVGEEGMVYALDKDKRALEELMQRAEQEGLRNIRKMHTSGEVQIKLDNESIDVVLLYDIFWYFPLTDSRLTELLAEVHRISRADALISVYPKHIDSERLKDKIESAGFCLKNRYSGVFIHDSTLHRDHVMNFTPCIKN